MITTFSHLLMSSGTDCEKGAVHFLPEHYLIVLLLYLSKILHRSALRKPRTPPEFLPRLRPRLHRTNHQRIAALGALPLGVGVIAALEVLHMFAVGGEGRRAATGLQGADQGGDLGVAEDRLLE